MVVDFREPPPIRASSVDSPIRVPTIYLAEPVALAHYFLDLDPTQPPVLQAEQGVVGPCDAL